MKKVFSLLCLSLLLSLGLVSCKDNSNTAKSIIEKPILLLPGLGFSVKPAIISANNKIFLLVSSNKGLTLYTFGKEVIVSQDKTVNQWLHYDGKNLYAFWWFADEHKAKSLKVAVSSDGGETFSAPTTINTDTGVLPDVSIASDGHGKLAVAYTDEREPGYGVYINYSEDSGKTWNVKDTRLDQAVLTPEMLKEGNTKPATFANSPKVAFVNNELVVVWQQIDVSQMGGYVLKIISKTSPDMGKTWSAEANVFSAPNMQPVEMAMFANSKEMYVFAMLTEGNKGFTGFYNKDASFSTWSEVSSAPLGANYDKNLISWIKGAFSGDNLVLAFTSELKEANEKLSAQVATLSTTTHSWLGEARALDADKGYTGITKSTYPDVVDAGSAGVYVVWEDYRTLASSIYLDISKDHGKTWLAKSMPLTTPGLSVAKSPTLLADANNLWLSYFMVELNGTNPAGQRVYQMLPKEGDAFKLPDIKVARPSPDEMKARLIERANQFWALREEKKWEETWNYMDPVYRERFDKQQWLLQQGKINFSKTVVDENSIKITGNIGVLDANIAFNVPQQVAREGILESAPPQDKKVDMRWGWFYNDWYFMPKVIFGEHMEY